MSCPHETTTTVAFLYGEAPDAHALHVAGCAPCTAVVAEHEQVANVLGPALSALRAPGMPRASRSRAPWITGAVLALAAAVLVLFRTVTVPAPVPPPFAPDGFDVAIDALDLELTSLELELL